VAFQKRGGKNVFGGTTNTAVEQSEQHKSGPRSPEASPTGRKSRGAEGWFPAATAEFPFSFFCLHLFAVSQADAGRKIGSKK
jgi:hypothetical protein